MLVEFRRQRLPLTGAGFVRAGSSVDFLEDLRHILNCQSALSGKLIAFHRPNQSGAVDIAISIERYRSGRARVADRLAVFDECCSRLNSSGPVPMTLPLGFWILRMESRMAVPSDRAQCSSPAPESSRHTGCRCRVRPGLTLLAYSEDVFLNASTSGRRRRHCPCRTRLQELRADQLHVVRGAQRVVEYQVLVPPSEIHSRVMVAPSCGNATRNSASGFPPWRRSRRRGE